MMTVLFIYISLALLLLDIALAWRVRGSLPDCVSACWYAIGYWHYFLLVGASMALLPYMLCVTKEDFQIVAFLCCACISFVGTAPNYKTDEMEHNVHFASAGLSAVCSIAWALAMCPPALACWVIALYSFVDSKRWLLWCELSCFGSVYAGLILNA